jgi:predicted acyl esterase
MPLDPPVMSTWEPAIVVTGEIVPCRARAGAHEASGSAGSVFVVSRRLITAVVAAVLVVSGGLAAAAPAAVASSVPAVRRAAPALQVQGSVNQVAVTGATPGASAELSDRHGHAVDRAPVDKLGSVLFRKVPAGTGYTVAVAGETAGPVTVTTPADTPPQSFYSSQHLSDGYGYLKTRDGTLLSVDVKLPGPADQGPYPTVVEYSGYDPSNPNGRQPASSIAALLGFATVGVNMRGTGCSGGSWDYFETLQSLDGYDAIETVAAQPWVANGKVGMVGISYPGITQLFVAATQPPHLAAITPLSPLDDTRATLYPGGILNDGFALSWAQDRGASAKPAGQKWAQQRIAGGDEICAANQALRLQSPDVLAGIHAVAYDRGKASDALAPATFVDRIKVPTFVAGAWQDEETGAHFAEMLDDFAPGVRLKATVFNGNHADSIGPAVLSRWVEFLDFYVAKKIPSIPPDTRALADVVLGNVFGAGARLEPDRFAGETDYAAALSQYEAEPELRVLFDVGATANGAPVASFADSFPAWPPKAAPTTWYFAADGKLVEGKPRGTGSDSYVYDPAALPATDAPAQNGGDALRGKNPAYDWKPVPDGKAVGYVTDPLTADTSMVGTGSVDVWLKATAPDVDLEVTITEVRPDGQETYVQSGWLRASQRMLDTRASTTLLPVQTHRKADVQDLPKGKAVLARVPLYPFGHVFRTGSRIRIVVQPPGGNRPLWAFDTLRPTPSPTVTVERSAAQPSKVVLPLVSGVSVTGTLPACGTLRGQPCRTYVPAANTKKSG